MKYQSGLSHVEQALGCGGAEAILGSIQDAMMALILLNVKMEDNIDCVLEELWAGRGSVLGDLSDNDEHEILLLRQPPQDIYAFSYLH